MTPPPPEIRVNLFLHWLACLLLKLLGWKVEGGVPESPQWVCVIAWHTSNWDFFLGLMISWACRIHTSWLGKASLFQGPLGWFYKSAGGVPVDRSQHHNLVEAAVDAFHTRPYLVFALTPEGTRKKTEYWKSGFYNIALAAKVPVCMAYIDYRRKVGGFGPVIHLTGDVEADLDKIREFYSTITAKYPELHGEIKFKPESPSSIKKD